MFPRVMANLSKDRGAKLKGLRRNLWQPVAAFINDIGAILFSLLIKRLKNTAAFI